MKEQENPSDTCQSKYNTPLVIGIDPRTALNIINITTTNINKALKRILAYYWNKFEDFEKSLIERKLCLVLSMRREEQKPRKKKS